MPDEPIKPPEATPPPAPPVPEVKPPLVPEHVETHPTLTEFEKLMKDMFGAFETRTNARFDAIDKRLPPEQKVETPPNGVQKETPPEPAAPVGQPPAPKPRKGKLKLWRSI